MNLEEHVPNTLDEAIEILTEYFKDHISEIRNMSESEFSGSVHMGAGMGIRNAWNLWWYDGHPYDGDGGWPEEKPKLTEYFNSIGIYHGDDLSGIIMSSFYRSVAGKNRDLEGQLEIYSKHWKEQGFEDGIYKPQ